MRRFLFIGTSAALAAVFTYGVVFSAENWNQPLPVPPWLGFFQRIAIAIERLWSHAHGWQPLSHIRDFGHFYAPTVQLVCPLLGFALFCALSRHKVGIHAWKPLAIGFLLTVPHNYPGYGLPWLEAVRTMLIVVLMAWSVGAISLAGWASSGLTGRRGTCGI